MTTTINASTSSGLVVSPDNSGVIALQNAGVTGLNLSSSGVITTPNQPAILVKGTGGGTAQTIASSTWTKVTTCTTTTYSRGGLTYDFTNYRCVAPVTGLYNLNWVVAVNGGTVGGDPICAPYVNGATTTYFSGDSWYGAGWGTAPSYTVFRVSTMLPLNSGDYVEIWLLQDSGASRTLYGDFTQFQMALIG